MQYYFIDANNQSQGPFEPAQLVQMGLTHQTLVWNETLTEWVPAAQVSELSALLPEQTFSMPPTPQQPPIPQQAYGQQQTYGQPAYGQQP